MREAQDSVVAVVDLSDSSGLLGTEFYAASSGVWCSMDCTPGCARRRSASGIHPVQAQWFIVWAVSGMSRRMFAGRLFPTVFRRIESNIVCSFIARWCMD